MACLSSTASCFAGRFKRRHLSPTLSSISSFPGARSVTVAAISPKLEHLRCELDAVSVATKECSEEEPISEQDVGTPPSKEEKRISGIHLPRQKYISVNKVDLLDAILSMFRTKKEIEEFKRLAMCLDSILHAEHKAMLEEMRACYSGASSQDKHAYEGSCSSIKAEDVSRKKNAPSEFSGHKEANGSRNDEVDKWLYLSDSLDLWKLFGQSAVVSFPESRATIAKKFQRSFMKLLRDAQFEELSIEDLLLADALNTDYLLRLPIFVDWKKTFDSNAIIFKRGYTTERQQGLLIVEKLDYLQSKLLDSIFSSLSKPMKKIGRWINEALKDSHEAQSVQIWMEKVKSWLRENYALESTLSFGESTSRDQAKIDQIEDSGLPVWLAAQKAVSLYEGLLSPIGPRGRLIRRLLAWIGVISSPPEVSIEFENEVYPDIYLRPNFLPRITLSNLWEPATWESCGYNSWKVLKTAAYILFSKSTLQEPAFQELVLLYADKGSRNENEDLAEINPVQLKIYEKIPIPDLSVIFPHKKLSFRILDTVRLDVASLVGLLAYFINYKFENIASSPSAVFLDVIAITALIIYITRVVLGYKQTTDRYQLLVNRTLYEKTLASGFGSVHFLLDASEQQQFKEAILVYSILLHPETYQVSCRKKIRESCEKFIYDRFREKIEMPIDKAVETLTRLGLLSEILVEGKIILTVLPSSDAFETLRDRWIGLLA
ncbi:uncharacterized protein LOC122021573 isoform X2 [Zingiber officinale]|uniref:uncharacterized protein LOC122021573 isoform X2 n=1 Tax=Zingiber officinale TaxID=94328 RepID=UPI001C4BDA49|nr:uncharacterized protein LOC122021573 isoform X2 [Zingiber officinale]